MTSTNSPTLLSQRLILRKFKESDVEALFELLSDEDVNTFLPWHPITSLPQAKQFLQERFLSYDHLPLSFRYAICLKEANRPIGYIWLSKDEPYDLGYALKKEYHNQKITSEAAITLLNQIKKTSIPYITATHDIHNPISGKVMKKIGLTYHYTYTELWQPKNKLVSFCFYQLNLDENKSRIYTSYLTSSIPIDVKGDHNEHS